MVEVVDSASKARGGPAKPDHPGQWFTEIYGEHQKWGAVGQLLINFAYLGHKAIKARYAVVTSTFYRGSVQVPVSLSLVRSLCNCLL